MRIAKVPTTSDNQAFGVVAALGAVAASTVGDIDLIVHGTTTTTNAVLERRLARTGMITTRGFRDIIELGRRTRPQAYGMTGTFVPVIPRNLRLEVSERVEASGAVRTPLDEGEVKAAVEQLLAAGCESLVIHFLHSYANPAHERRAAEIAAELWPNGYITTGHSLLSEAREFERGVTASVNASVQPILERYVHRLRDELERLGYQRDFLIMNGNGGMISARFVARDAAKTVMSGPASGVIAAAYTGKRAGHQNLVTYDMGGTSTDVALILDAEPAVSNETEIEYAMPIHVPMVAVHTVGAGGGSIARVDASGLIQVGPESAGANPGPICYGRGGTEPTITDANLAARPARPETAARGRCAGDGRAGEEDFRREDRPRRRPRRRRCRGRGAQARQPQDGRRDPHGLGVAAATTPGTSRFSPSVAQGRCMRRRSRANSACRPCWCRRVRASPTRWAAWSPTSGTTSSTRSTSRCRCSTKPGCATSCSRHRRRGRGADRQGGGRRPRRSARSIPPTCSFWDRRIF